LHIAITGSSGLIGRTLITALQAGDHRVTRVLRTDSSSGAGIRWDPGTGTIDAAGFEGVDAVVNLSGRNIGEHR